MLANSGAGEDLPKQAKFSPWSIILPNDGKRESRFWEQRDRHEDTSIEDLRERSGRQADGEGSLIMARRQDGRTWKF